MPFDTSFATGDTVTSTDLNTIAGAWDAYTPTLSGTGWALGNGTIVGRWKKVGRMVGFYINLTFGSTSTFGTGALNLTLPVAANNANHQFSARYSDTGTAGYQGVGFSTAGSTTLGLYVFTASGTYVGESTIINTIPHTWANTDFIRVSGVYESNA